MQVRNPRTLNFNEWMTLMLDWLQVRGSLLELLAFGEANKSKGLWIEL